MCLHIQYFFLDITYPEVKKKYPEVILVSRQQWTKTYIGLEIYQYQLDSSTRYRSFDFDMRYYQYRINKFLHFLLCDTGYFLPPWSISVRPTPRQSLGVGLTDIDLGGKKYPVSPSKSCKNLYFSHLSSLWVAD